MRKFILLILSFSIYNVSKCQQLPVEWIKSFQGQGKASDRIASISTDASGNIYIAGYAGKHHGSPDAFAMKRNLQGDTLWTYYYDAGDNKEDYASEIVVDNSGNAYVTGKSQSVTSYFFDCFTVKIDPSGNEAWSARYSAGTNAESFGNGIAVDVSGNVYVAGYTDPATASTDWLVIKYNSSGVQQWVDVMNGPGNGGDEALDIVIAPNGNATVCGYAYSINTSGYINAFVKQYTSSGTTVWSDTWNNSSVTGSDKASGLAYNLSGDLFVGGETDNNNTSNRDVFAIRYDGSGIRQWVTVYSDSTSLVDEYLQKVAVDNSGNIYFTGTDYLDGFVTCIHSDGTQGWRKEWRGPLNNGYDVFHGIAIDNYGGIYVTGRGVYPGEDYYGNGGLPNMIVAKYNSSGDSLWTYRCIDSLNSSMGFAITSKDGKVFAGGFVTDTAYVDENLYTLIIDTAGSSISEWIYNGVGDAITMGQFVQTDANDNVYCAATVDRLYSQGYDVVLIKYDPAGNLLWEKYYSSYGWNNDTLTDMQMDPSGNLILCVSTDSAQLKNNYILSLLKVDQSGNFIDTAALGGPAIGSILSTSMAVGSSGSVALSAVSNIHGGIVIHFDPTLSQSWWAKIDSTPFAATHANSLDIFPNGDLLVGGNSQTSGSWTGIIQRYNSAGLKLWSTNVDSSNVYDEIKNVTIGNSGDVAFTGASGGANTFTAMTGKLDGSTGNLTWRQIYNPNTANEYGVKIRFTPAGNVVLISRGWTGFVARYFIVQYSGTGSLLWANTYNQTASDREPVDLIVEPTNRVVTAGWEINGFTTNYDYVLAGYSSAGIVEFINTYSNSLPVSFSWDQLRDLTRDNQGNFIVTGQSSREFFNNYLFKMLTIKYGANVVGMEDKPEWSNRFAFVYPNPSVTGKFELVDASPYKIVSAKVYDLQGRYVTSMKMDSYKVDLEKQGAGIYVLVLERESSLPERICLIVR